MALFANLSVPTMVDPAPANGATGSLPPEGLLGGAEAEGQSSTWTVVPAQKPGSRGNFNQGTN